MLTLSMIHKLAKHSSQKIYIKKSVYGATSIVTTSLWSFGNDYAKNGKIFCINNSASFQADNCKNKILKLIEEDTYVINGS